MLVFILNEYLPNTKLYSVLCITLNDLLASFPLFMFISFLICNCDFILMQGFTGKDGAMGPRGPPGPPVRAQWVTLPPSGLQSPFLLLPFLLVRKPDLNYPMSVLWGILLYELLGFVFINQNVLEKTDMSKYRCLIKLQLRKSQTDLATSWLVS